MPVDLVAFPAASSEAVAAFDESASESSAPAARPRPSQSSNLGILSRLPLLESALGPAPIKSPLLRTDTADHLLLPPQAPIAGLGRDLAAGVHRGAVGTARKPTGPPS